MATVVDGQNDPDLSQYPLPELNEGFDLQHSTNNDVTEEPPVNLLSDQNVNNSHPVAPTATTDVHSRSEAESSSEDGNTISLDVLEAEWDHESNDVEHSSEDSGHSSKVVVPSTYTGKAQELKDMNQSRKFPHPLIQCRFNDAFIL